MLLWPNKDPDEVLDYVVDWTERLAGDTISSSNFSIVSGGAALVIDSEGNTTEETTVWLSGGTLDASYEVLNRVTTAGGRTMDQTVKLKIKRK